MTRMSRGSKVGSAWSIPSSTSRSTSTCRAVPWQACTRTLRSSAASRRPSAATLLLRRSSCSQPSSVSGVAGEGRWRSVAAAAARDNCSSRLSRPRVASRGWSATWWLVSAARSPAVVPAAARRAHSTSLGWGSQRCTSRCSARPESSSTSVTGSRVCPNSERRAGRSSDSGRSRSRARVSAWRTFGGGASIRSTSRRQSSGCQVRSSSRPAPRPSESLPRLQSARTVGRCTAYAAKSRDSLAATAYRRPWRSSASAPVSKWPRCRATGRTSRRRASRRAQRAAATPSHPRPSGRHP